MKILKTICEETSSGQWRGVLLMEFGYMEIVRPTLLAATTWIQERVELYAE